MTNYVCLYLYFKNGNEPVYKIEQKKKKKKNNFEILSNIFESFLK